MSINVFRSCSMLQRATYCVLPRSAPKATLNALNTLLNASNDGLPMILINPIASPLVNIRGVFLLHRSMFGLGI